MKALTESVQELAKLLKQARYAVALTGAGVSTESGIPDFRSPQSGLWQQVDPFKVASIEGFRRDPESFYEFWSWRFAKLTEAKPNVIHMVLAELERKGLLKALITQNIDNLHRRAGSKKIYEVHGNYTRGLCVECHKRYEITALFEKVKQSKVPYCDDCYGLLKPDVVLFGELLPSAFYESVAEVEKADLMLVLGTSLEVYPVAELIPQAQRSGAKIAILNRETTPFDRVANLVIHSQLGQTMELLRKLISGDFESRLGP